MFVHLHVHSPFSFLDGASSIKELVSVAAKQGMYALALTDHDNVCGAVEFYRAAEQAGIKPIQGVELTLKDGSHLVLLAENSAGYANLCKIISHAHLSNPRNNPAADPEFIAAHCENVIALSGCRRGSIPTALLRGERSLARSIAERWRAVFGKNNFFLELQNNYLPATSALNNALVELASDLDLGIVATNNVHYATADNALLHDVLSCVRTKTRLEDVHPERPLNTENHLASEEEMQQRLAAYREALANTELIAKRCQPVIDKSRRLFPKYPIATAATAAEKLRALTLQGAIERYGKITAGLKQRLEHELSIICQLGVEDYFLAVWDIAQFARREGIRYSGRGSAADSVVAYCLRLTEVDAYSRGLMFERFLSLERSQQPDIDLDFDARYRDQVADYVYKRYGPEKVASVCTFNTYRARSVVRDFGEALGFPDEEIDHLAKRLPHIPADAIEQSFSRFPELANGSIPKERFRLLIELGAKAAGFPRFIGTHLGGLVISNVPLTEITPLQASAKGVLITQFDKDSIEELGLIKLDLLSLHTLSAVDDALVSLNSAGTSIRYEAIPLDDHPTFEMINKGETIGVFQLESPAQRALQGRLKADNIEDIVASVALIRPGPIKGDMVEPFISRHHGGEPIEYIHPSLEPILSKTYGVVLFQEQVIQIATAIAGFTPGEADRLRKVMTHFRSQNEMDEIGRDFVKKAVARGVKEDVAQTIFSYIVGYAGYGFCEAHAAAFSDIAYKTAYLIKHYPAHFYAAILSNQPMGFYSPATICLEARRRGIRLLPVDVNRSLPHFSVEDGAIRVGLKQVRGMTEDIAEAIVQTRKEKSFTSLPDLCRRVKPPRNILENLVLCGALDCFQHNRRQLLWQVTHSASAGKPFVAGQEQLDCHMPPATPGDIPDFTPYEKCIYEYYVLHLNVSDHVMYHLRSKAGAAVRQANTTAEAKECSSGRRVSVAGLVTRPHRPPTRSGKTVLFFMLEDEHGILDVTMFEKVYKKYGHLVFSQPALLVEGTISRRGESLSLIADRVSSFM